MARRFCDRTDAGQRLAARLQEYSERSDTIVLGLPRGGVPVAFEVAQSLHLPLDICLVRKLGAPGQPELAMGAIASNGVRVINQQVVERLGIFPEAIDQVAAKEQVELERRNLTYRQGRPPLQLTNQTVILIDDGVATGSTLRAAIAVIKAQHPTAIIVAVPVAPPATVASLKQEVDEVICPLMPEALNSISLWYENFDQTRDRTVCELLAQAASVSTKTHHPLDQPWRTSQQSPPQEQQNGSE
ncbi:Putative phosphoribosyl transferase [Halomicronema hongdechloris C2206]|uniref:Phosphoribosyl transferase n=1 Tax=Halomicronema hongdechloris C2206 TaxID=1641165 RepID=A0A1Z3HH07_9CYAN|nr:phosphoribosyltransferase [Halomicronema hongdechloris]ASC69612.1 Putative phosphoribosyl transferase [Halomicronema hongdechloris C2206]